MRLFAYHENAESVPALLAALARHIEVHAFRVVNPSWYLKARRRRPTGFYWERAAGAAHQGLALVPGVRRFPGPSSLMLRRSYRAAVRRSGTPDYLLIDSPYLEPLTAAEDVPLIYLAADPYRFYGWPRERTEALEAKILARAHATFAVSELLAEDFRAAGADPVFLSNTAVGADFVAAADAATTPPTDLEAVPRPRVGVVGKINSTQDWRLIESLSEARPQVSFVFVGPNTEEDVSQQRRIERVFARPSVLALGPRPHAALPAYLNAMDVLFNPLEVRDHNDRRFPLRLCEYLATDRPVLTTTIHEARSFAPHVVPVSDADEALAALDAALGGQVAIDVAGRRDWLERNSWAARAANVLSSLRAADAAERAPDR